MNRFFCFLLLQLAAQAQPLTLSLEEAVRIALAPSGNHRLAIVRESIAGAEARQRQARSAFLPQVDGSVSAANQTRNLTAFGFQFPSLPIPGFSIPSFVGPFTVVDYRASASQSILDFASLRRLSAARMQVRAAEAEAKAAREATAALVARLYTQALRAEAYVSAAQANLQLAERLLRLAQGQKEAGTGTGLEVTRARVELANSRQRLLDAQTRRHRAQMELKRAMNLELSQVIELSSKVNDGSESAPDETALLRTALAQRNDLLSLARRKEALAIQQDSIAAERFPSVGAAADYGSIGNGSSQLPTRSVGISLRVPIFDGGRRAARRAETGIALRQEELREKDLRSQIELDLRIALDNWRSSQEQIAAARLGLDLAEQELAQAERRLAAGVAMSIEITDAQARLERSRDNYLNALYQFNMARIDVAAATGSIEEAVKGLSQ